MDAIKLQQAHDNLIDAVNAVVLQVVAAGEDPNPAQVKAISSASATAVFALLMAAREIWRSA